MDSSNQSARSTSWAARAGVIGAVASAALLAGCGNGAPELGYLPSASRGATSHTDAYTALWTGGWIAALGVGAVTWGLMLFCIIAYRRRKSDRGLPVQLQYNMPVEIMYTVVPILLIMGFFFHNMALFDKTTHDKTPGQEKIEVVGKQWSWDFNYTSQNVHLAGKQANLDGTAKPGEEAPTLYLPVNTDLEIQLRSRDVIHSFWVPAFLEKRDMTPGRIETLHFKATKEGEYLGKCAELCGEFHSEMLFNVKVVSKTEYDAYIESLRKAGNTGLLGEDLDRTHWYSNPYAKEGADK